MMGVQNLNLIVTSLLEVGRLPETPIALIERGTLPEQRLVKGTLANILEKTDDIEPPAIIIIGEVVRLGSSLEWFKSDPDLSTIG
jgi:siroheme synthase